MINMGIRPRTFSGWVPAQCLRLLYVIVKRFGPMIMQNSMVSCTEGKLVRAYSMSAVTVKGVRAYLHRGFSCSFQWEVIVCKLPNKRNWVGFAYATVMHACENTSLSHIRMCWYDVLFRTLYTSSRPEHVETWCYILHVILELFIYSGCSTLIAMSGILCAWGDIG